MCRLEVASYFVSQCELHKREKVPQGGFSYIIGSANEMEEAHDFENTEGSPRGLCLVGHAEMQTQQDLSY